MELKITKVEGLRNTNLYNDRFFATKRTALDGKTYWVVFDKKIGGCSTLNCFSKYKLKKSCEWAIKYVLTNPQYAPFVR